MIGPNRRLIENQILIQLSIFQWLFIQRVKRLFIS